MRRLHALFVPILGLAVLLVSTAGLVGHDHGLTTELAAYGCSADHDAGHGEGNGRGLHAGGDEHRHVCPACHLNGQRLLTATPGEAVVERAATRLAVAALATPLRLARWTHPPHRGPPA